MWRLAVLASAAFLGSIAAGAWEPMLVAAALTPGACALYMAKPNVGLALASGLPRRRATYIGIGIAVLLCVASLIIRPGWIPEWREALRGGVHLGGPDLAAGRIPRARGAGQVAPGRRASAGAHGGGAAVDDPPGGAARCF